MDMLHRKINNVKLIFAAIASNALYNSFKFQILLILSIFQIRIVIHCQSQKYDSSDIYFKLEKRNIMYDRLCSRII